MADEISPVQDTGTTAQDAEGKTFDAEYVAKLRQEAAKYRTEKNALAEQIKTLAPKAAQLDELTEAQKTEQQKLVEKLEQLQAQLTQAQAQQAQAAAEAQLLRLAGMAGVDPDVAVMLDISKIDFADEAKALEVLKKFAPTKTPPATSSQVRPGVVGGVSEDDLRAQYLGGKNRPMIFGG